MKTVPLYGLLALFLLPAFQQPTVTDAAPGRCETAEFDFSPYSGMPFVTLVWKRPAAFPQPSKSEFESKDFAIDCPDFSAQNSGGTFRIRAKTLDAAYRRFGKVYALLVSGWLYPNIRAGFYAHYIQFVFAQSSLTLDADITAYLTFRDAVIGAKVNDGDLKPLYFEGKATPLSFSQTDKVDVFVKMTGSGKDYVKIPRLTIDAKNGEIILYSSALFPVK